MRWVCQILYPIFTLHLQHRQFGGRQGMSRSHATHIFLPNINSMEGCEAVLTFGIYHAFANPPPPTTSYFFPHFFTLSFGVTHRIFFTVSSL